jgi:hypothetical protein
MRVDVFTHIHTLSDDSGSAYYRNDWQNFWTTGKAMSGAFAKIPEHEKVQASKLLSIDRKAWEEEMEDTFKEWDEQATSAEETDPYHASSTEEYKLQWEDAQKNIKRKKQQFRTEQLPVRHINEMLLTFARAWAVPPTADPAEKVLIIDPFAGSGSTGMAAYALDCDFIGFDCDPTAQDLWHGYGADNLTAAGTYERMIHDAKHKKVSTRCA